MQRCSKRKKGKKRRCWSSICSSRRVKEISLSFPSSRHPPLNISKMTQIFRMTWRKELYKSLKNRQNRKDRKSRWRENRSWRRQTMFTRRCKVLEKSIWSFAFQTLFCTSYSRFFSTTSITRRQKCNRLRFFIWMLIDGHMDACGFGPLLRLIMGSGPILSM